MDRTEIGVKTPTWAKAAKVGFWISVSLAMVATAMSVVLFNIAESRYRREQSVRMDPTGAARFEPLNARLEPPVDGRRRIVLFGDSRIEGWNPPLNAENIEVVNRGWWGETTGQAVLRLDRDVIRLQPAMVVIEYGINDLKGIGLFPEQEAEIVDTCLRNLEATVNRLREQKINVVLLTVFPVGPIPLLRRPIWSNRILGAVERVNREMHTLAGPGVDIVDCDPVLGENGRMKSAFAADEFHLTPMAYDALNVFLQPRLSVVASPTKLLKRDTGD
jgi:lysophospholipase L1-like esterase